MIYGHGKIGRNVTVSHCYGQRINPDNPDASEFVDYSIDIYGCFTEQRATRFARRVIGDRSIIINKVEFETHHYVMELAKFIDNAERTDNDY